MRDTPSFGAVSDPAQRPRHEGLLKRPSKIGPRALKKAGHLKNRAHRLTVERVRTHITNPLLGRTSVNFLHIRKTGGSVIWKALVNRASRRYDVRMHRHEVTLGDITDGMVFFFVREPLSRFESGFYDRLRRGRPKYDKPWTESERRAFERFPSPNSLGNALYTDEHPHAADALRSIEHVNSSYWDWFGNEQQFQARVADLFFIGFQERLEEDFDRLCTKLDIRARLSTDPVVAHLRPHPIEPLQPEAAEKLRRWYRREYDFWETCQRIAPAVNDANPHLTGTV